MIARILTDQAEMPGGGKELRLYQHDKDFYILAGSDAFTARLNKVGFEVEEIRCRARPGNKGPHHLIWIATKR